MSPFFSSPQLLLPFVLLLLLTSSRLAAPAQPTEEEDSRRTYIVQLHHSQKPQTFKTNELWHISLLKSVSSSSSSYSPLLLYSFHHVFHGFSARLTASQLSQLENSSAHLATYEESFGKLLTTHTPKFLGLRRRSGIWPAASFGEDVIIGVFDTGIWPESQSFRDKGMSPVPKRWKGKCENGTGFDPSTCCNRKLIGARSFRRGFIAEGGEISPDDYESPRGSGHHGTHVASTAAGTHVPRASHFGYAIGTARGVAPGARIAMYKVGWKDSPGIGISASDLLAAMDTAISDGVDVMSLSIGFIQTQYFQDLIAIASLSAVEKGISVVCAAGNDHFRGQVANAAPWITTVGAGTVDRSFVATMQLASGLSVDGTSYYPVSILMTNTHLYYGEGNRSKEVCESLDYSEVLGKIVICDNSTKIRTLSQIGQVQRAGGSAGVLLGSRISLEPKEYSFPSLILQKSDWDSVKDYATSGNETMVKSLRFTGTKLGTRPAPQVADFSSKGPNPITPGILKPDILAPGVDILAAVPPNTISAWLGDNVLASEYAIASGTSMAAPHVAGVTSLLKAVFKEWSPGAIRSAIMTTAYTVDNTNTTIQDQRTGLPLTPLDFGAGHINPNRAMDPGLVYDISSQDYVDFLCGLGYTRKQMRAVLRRSTWSCIRNTDLNYPSFTFVFPGGGKSSSMVKNFSRVVTNVGQNTATYRAVSVAPVGMKIRVEPEILRFTRKYQRQRFSVHVEIEKDASQVQYGYLRWTDDHKHVVSSPVVAISEEYVNNPVL